MRWDGNKCCCMPRKQWLTVISQQTTVGHVPPTPLASWGLDPKAGWRRAPAVLCPHLCLDCISFPTPKALAATHVRLCVGGPWYPLGPGPGLPRLWHIPMANSLPRTPCHWCKVPGQGAAPHAAQNVFFLHGFCCHLGPKHSLSSCHLKSWHPPRRIPMKQDIRVWKNHTLLQLYSIPPWNALDSSWGNRWWQRENHVECQVISKYNWNSLMWNIIKTHEHWDAGSPSSGVRRMMGRFCTSPGSQKPRQVHKAIVCLDSKYCPCLFHNWDVEGLVRPTPTSTKQELLVLTHFWPPTLPRRMLPLPKEAQPVAPTPAVSSDRSWKAQIQLKNSIAQIKQNRNHQEVQV